MAVADVECESTVGADMAVQLCERVLDRVIAEELVKDSLGFIEAGPAGRPGQFKSMSGWEAGTRRSGVRLG